MGNYSDVLLGPDLRHRSPKRMSLEDLLYKEYRTKQNSVGKGARKKVDCLVPKRVFNSQKNTKLGKIRTGSSKTTLNVKEIPCEYRGVPWSALRYLLLRSAPKSGGWNEECNVYDIVTVVKGDTKPFDCSLAELLAALYRPPKELPPAIGEVYRPFQSPSGTGSRKPSSAWNRKSAQPRKSRIPSSPRGGISVGGRRVWEEPLESFYKPGGPKTGAKGSRIVSVRSRKSTQSKEKPKPVKDDRKIRLDLMQKMVFGGLRKPSIPPDPSEIQSEESPSYPPKPTQADPRSPPLHTKRAITPIRRAHTTPADGEIDETQYTIYNRPSKLKSIKKGSWLEGAPQKRAPVASGGSRKSTGEARKKTTEETGGRREQQATQIRESPQQRRDPKQLQAENYQMRRSRLAYKQSRKAYRRSKGGKMSSTRGYGGPRIVRPRIRSMSPPNRRSREMRKREVAKIAAKPPSAAPAPPVPTRSPTSILDDIRSLLKGVDLGILKEPELRAKLAAVRVLVIPEKAFRPTPIKRANTEPRLTRARAESDPMRRSQEMWDPKPIEESPKDTDPSSGPGDEEKEDHPTFSPVCGKPDIFISYPWQTKFFDLCFRALGWQLGLNNHETDKKIWIDIFAVTQNWGKRSASDLLAIERAIKMAGTTIVFFPDPSLKINPLNRIWCCFEIFVTLQNNCELHVLFPGKTEFARLANALMLYSGRLDGKVRVQNAKATKDADRKMILEKIKQSEMSFDGMNKKIEAALRKSAGHFLRVNGFSAKDLEQARTAISDAMRDVKEDWFTNIKKRKLFDRVKMCVSNGQWRKLYRVLVPHDTDLVEAHEEDASTITPLAAVPAAADSVEPSPAPEVSQTPEVKQIAPSPEECVSPAGLGVVRRDSDGTSAEASPREELFTARVDHLAIRDEMGGGVFASQATDQLSLVANTVVDHNALSSSDYKGNPLAPIGPLSINGSPAMGVNAALCAARAGQSSR